MAVGRFGRPHRIALDLGVGLYAALLGLLALVAPHQLATFGGQLHMPPWAWGHAYLASGLALISSIAVRPGRPWNALAHILAGTVLLAGAADLPIHGAWPESAMRWSLGLFTLSGIAARPNLVRRATGESRPDLLAIAAGVGLVLAGTGVILFELGSAGSLAGGEAGSTLGWGALTAAVGAALVFAQVRGRGRSVRARTLRTGGVVCLGWLATRFASAAGVAELLLWGGLGAALLSLTSLAPALAAMKARGLRNRLAVTLTLAAVAPALLISSVGLGRLDAAARMEALEDQHRAAELLAGTIAEYAAHRQSAAAAMGDATRTSAELSGLASYLDVAKRHGARVTVLGADGTVLLQAGDRSPGGAGAATRTRTGDLGQVESSGIAGHAVYGDGDDERLAGYAPVGGSDWTVLVERRAADVLAVTRRVREVTYLFLLGLICGVIVLAHWLAGRFVAPLDKLRRVAGQIGRGAQAVRPKRERTPSRGASAEIDELLMAFEGMQEALEVAVIERQRLQDATAALAAARTVDDVGAAVVEAGRLAMGARAAWLSALDETGAMVAVRSAGDCSDVTGEANSTPPNASAHSPILEPGAEAARPAGAVPLPGAAEAVQRHSVPEVSASATEAIPLFGSQEAVGILGLGFERVRDWTGEDRAFALAFGRLAGQALDRARAYEREQRTRTELEAILDAAGDGILVVDTEGRLRRLNRRAMELLGSPDPPPETIDDIRELVAAVRGDGQPAGPVTAEHALAGREIDQEFAWRAGRVRRVHARSAPIRAGDGAIVGAVSVWRDITDLHKAISERSALEGARLTARRVAHEMGNTLQSLVVHAELAQALEPDLVPPHLVAVRRDASRAAALLQRLHRIVRAVPIDLGGQEVLDLDGAVDPPATCRRGADRPATSAGGRPSRTAADGE